MLDFRPIHRRGQDGVIRAEDVAIQEVRALDAAIPRTIALLRGRSFGLEGGVAESAVVFDKGVVRLR